jgi:methyl-accepting chemotaxis protein
MNSSKIQMAAKLWLALGAFVIALVAVIGFAGWRFITTQTEGEAALKAVNRRVEAATRWAGLTEANAARTQALVLSNEAVVEVAFKDVIAATSAKISEVQKSIEGMTLQPEDRAQLQKIAASRKAMVDLRGAARALKLAGKQDDAMAMVGAQYNPAVSVYLTNLRDFVAMQEKALVQTQTNINDATAFTLKITGAMLMLMLMLLIVGAMGFIRSILTPLGQANALAARIAAGDLSATIAVDRGDEFGDLIRSLLTMSQSLGHMVRQVRQSTDSIAIASAEIAAGNNDLSQRTEQTSSDLQQTSASMGQLTQTVQQSVGSAQQASKLAANASVVAERGGVVVTQVVATMEDINHSSKKIADIIGVIDGIAFQTNILALNAAVEAARAGEQGRGFAVVASEVRNLAQRSAQAAKEIKVLIDASVDKVESGARLVAAAGTTMTDIVQSVRQVTQMIGEITAAASTQSAGIADVNDAVTNLDQMTQQNAALVEESAAAAQSLRDQADQLTQVVAAFKISSDRVGVNDGGTHTAVMPAPVRANARFS